MSKKILIYGEYSGYGNSLVKGFRELGFKSDIFSPGKDGFKSIDVDFCLNNKSRMHQLYSMLRLIPKFLTYDVIFVMNPSFLRFKLMGPLVVFLLRILNKKINLLCCGDDVYFIRSGLKGEIGEWPYVDCELPKPNYFQSVTERFINYLVASASDNIIPTMYDYAIPWKQSIFKHKVRDTIPLACNKTPSIIINEDRKLTIMHGINREGFKGTKKIMEALERIKKEFGSEVNILYPEKLPLNDYLKLMADVDIAIDQCKGNSYGMNAIFSMFSGHIVLAPANDKFIKDMKLEFCPVVSIGNDSNDIYLKLKCLILNKKNIYDMKVRTQEYAVDLHSSINVARRMKLFI